MGAFDDEDRVTYQTLKEWALDSFFDYCRDRGIVMSMSHFEVLGYVGYDFEDGFERDIEDLMTLSRITDLLTQAHAACFTCDASHSFSNFIGLVKPSVECNCLAL